MSSFWWLVLGLLAGWLIELVIDYRYWRRQARVEAVRLAEQEAALNARVQTLERRQAEQDQRNDELNALQEAVAARDVELLTSARRIDERAEEVSRLEQAMDKRRADLDRMALTLNEREKDITGRDGRLKAAEADYLARIERLETAEADVSRRIAVVSNRESAMQNWEGRILAREHELTDKEADLVREAAAAADLRAERDAMRNLVSRQYKTADRADDLEAIAGVGPKVAALLHDAGIRTFERLSETSLGELTRILEAGGPRLGLADPLSWAEQAGLLVNGDYLAFERLKEDLAGGRRRDAALLQKAAEGDAPVAGMLEENEEAGEQAGNSGTVGVAVSDVAGSDRGIVGSGAGPATGDAQTGVGSDAGRVAGSNAGPDAGTAAGGDARTVGDCGHEDRMIRPATSSAANHAGRAMADEAGVSREADDHVGGNADAVASRRSGGSGDLAAVARPDPREPERG